MMATPTEVVVLVVVAEGAVPAVVGSACDGQAASTRAMASCSGGETQRRNRTLTATCRATNGQRKALSAAAASLRRPHHLFARWLTRTRPEAPGGRWPGWSWWPWSDSARRFATRSESDTMWSIWTASPLSRLKWMVVLVYGS